MFDHDDRQKMSGHVTTLVYCIERCGHHFYTMCLRRAVAEQVEAEKSARVLHELSNLAPKE